MQLGGKGSLFQVVSYRNDRRECMRHPRHTAFAYDFEEEAKDGVVAMVAVSWNEHRHVVGCRCVRDLLIF